MEYEELEKLWKKYDNRLNSLEKMNMKLIRETLLKKTTKKLNWYKFQSIYGLLAGPVIIIVALHPNFIKSNLDIKFLIGCIVTLGVVVYLSILQFKSYSILKTINLGDDSVLDAAIKIAGFKDLYNSRWKHAIVYYPVLCVGVLLIAWNSFHFNTKTILFLVVLFIVTYIINIKGPAFFRDRLEKMEKELIEIEEYQK